MKTIKVHLHAHEILTFETSIDLHKFQGGGFPMSLISIDSKVSAADSDRGTIS